MRSSIVLATGTVVGQVVRLLRFAWKELRSQVRLQSFLIFNLAFGLFGFFLLQTFQESLTLQTQSKAQEILGGDVGVSSRKIIEPETLKEIERNFKFSNKSENFSFFAMASARSSNAKAASDSKSRLVRARTFDEQFPLYGKMELSSPLVHNQRKIWVDPELVGMLGLSAGSKIKLGEVEFDFAGTIDKDPSRAFRAGGFAPVAFISAADLEATGLLQAGSTVFHSINYLLSNSDLRENSPEQVVSKLSSAVRDISIRFETAAQDADDDNRVLKYFSDYLGLVSLIALGLCFLCGGYLLRWIFLQQKKNLAIFKTLGMQESELVSVQVIKNTIVSIGALMIALVAVVLVTPLIQSLISQFGLPLILRLEPKSIFVTSFLALAVPQMMSFPLMLEMVKLSPKELFQPLSVSNSRSLGFWIWLVACVLLFWALTVWQSQSFRTGSLFTGGLLAIYFIFKTMLWLSLKLIEALLSRLKFLNQYALKSLIRKSASTDLVFITMSLALLVLCLLPHIKTSIISEIRPSEASKIPSLFLFDIQPDQKADIVALAEAESKTNGERSSLNSIELNPMVRSRIIKMNDENYERADQSGQGFSTREDEEEARFRNRGVNLSYKTKLDDSEKVVEGQWKENWTEQELSEIAAGDRIPEISLEFRFAGRINAKLGDVLTFDVQGLEVKGKVTSIRQVRWTSFKPNFFIVFQPGVLEEAPQMFLSALSISDDKTIDQFQNSIVDKFSNVSVINVKRAVQDSLVYIDQMSIALEGMAIMSIIIGLFVFIILLNTQIRERITEMNLLQILGLDNFSVVQIVARQFFFLILMAVIGGVSLSFLSVFVVMTVIFDIGTTFDYAAIVNLLLVLIPITIVALWIGLKPLKKLSPNDLIRSS